MSANAREIIKNHVARTRVRSSDQFIFYIQKRIMDAVVVAALLMLSKIIIERTISSSSQRNMDMKQFFGAGSKTSNVATVLNHPQNDNEIPLQLSHSTTQVGSFGPLAEQSPLATEATKTVGKRCMGQNETLGHHDAGSWKGQSSPRLFLFFMLTDASRILVR